MKYCDMNEDQKNSKEFVWMEAMELKGVRTNMIELKGIPKEWNALREVWDENLVEIGWKNRKWFLLGLILNDMPTFVGIFAEIRKGWNPMWIIHVGELVVRPWETSYDIEMS